nr:cadherin domain-containing protein [Novosphingobium aerophilum]
MVGAVDPSTGARYWIVFDASQNVIARIDDTIEAESITRITATAAAETIDLRNAKLADQRGFTVNGKLNNDIAVAGSDFTALTQTVTFAAGEVRQSVNVTVTKDALAEAAESFLGTLSNGTGLSIVGGSAEATVVDGTAALPTLMVGRSFAREGDGYAVFRVSLSRAATGAVSASLAVLDDTTTLGVDRGAGIEVSDDGVTWTAATALTFAAGQVQKFVRVAVLADNVANPDYVAPTTDPLTGATIPGNGKPQFLNVEGNERFTLSATVTAGASLIANAADVNGVVSARGTGTILDATTGTLPLAWIDAVTLDEASGQATFSIARSSGAGTGSLTFATADRKELAIDIAATVDAGAGNDLVYASNLGDNVFGGAGNDTLYGGRLDDWLLGGDGDDVLDAGGPDAGALGGDGNYLNGGAGNDSLRGREGSDWIEGGEGADTLTGGGGDDILAGGAGDGDQLAGGAGNDQYVVRRGDGLDTINDEAVGAPVAATTGGDAISQRFAGIANGTIKADWAGTWGGVVNDNAAGGEDAVVFGAGIEIGDIQLKRSGTAAAPGNDLIIMVMQTVNGVESFSGTQLTIRDWFANPFKRVEWLKFADGTELRLGDLSTFITGTSGNDVLIGGLGNDELIGGRGNDVLSGDAGADDLYGGADNDVLSGGRGDGDVVVGGAGDDTFKYARGDGRDMVFDEFINAWTVIWTAAGGWNTAAGIVFDQSTGVVTGPGGVVLRRNTGTATNPDYQWVGRYDYDSSTGTLRMFTPPASATTLTANAGTDRIEFAAGINIQDVILRKSGNDLVLAISDENDDLASYAGVKDSLTIKDWYLAPGAIERLAFIQTGILDISLGKTTLIAGTDGADGTSGAPLSGTAGADWITGGAGDDVIAGGAGNDILAGNSGFDLLRGEAGNDVLYGGTGNDVLDGGSGADTLIGGLGQDAASYASAAAAVRAMLSAPSTNSGDAIGDTYTGIEDLIGGSGADVLGGDAGQNVLTGGAGNDQLMGGAGDDVYVWNVGDGADTIWEGAFSVQEVVTTAGTLASGYAVSIWQATGTKTVTGNFYWRLQIKGPDGAIVYDDSTLNYAQATGVAQPAIGNLPPAGWLSGFARTNNGLQVARQLFDTVTGGGADDIEFGAGISLTDLTFVRSGNDLIIRYGGSTASQITIKNQTLTASAIEAFRLADGQSVSLASILIATSAAQLVGTTGDDLLVGQTGALADNLSGGDGNDVLVGYDGADTLSGGNGDDVLEGGAGADRLDGGANAAGGAGDTVRYVRSAAAVTVNLTLATAQSGGDAAGDVLIGIENVTGSAFGDTLTGDGGDNRLFGLDGADTIRGGAGKDVLTGDGGDDWLYGEAGEDNLAGGDGVDRLWGGSEKDVLDGGEGADQLYGEAGDDRLTGGAAADLLDGGDGNDVLLGGADADTLTGGAGNDTLAGGLGADALSGGLGNDTYLFDAASGSDTLTDADGVNAVVFDGTLATTQLWLMRSGNDLRISVIGGDAAITLKDYYLASGGTRVRTVSTATHTLYLAYAAPLIDAMTAAGTTPPASMSATVAALLPTYWHEGHKAAPTGQPIALTILEDSPTALTGTGAIDQDENITGYQLGKAAANGVVTLNPTTGQFTYRPNADANGTDSFSVIVTDADGKSAEIPVNLTITPVNDAPRNLQTKTGQPIALAESAAASPIQLGALVAEFTATDPEGEAIRYSLLNNAGGRFALSSDGKLTVADPVRIDFETGAAQTITVRATDASGAATDQLIQVTLTDVNEANSLPATYAFGVNENVPIGTAVGAVAAVDLDTTGSLFAQQRYAFLVGGAASATSADGRYAINAVTGQITTAAALNFEAGTPSQVYTVIARDNAGNAGYLQAQSAVTIGIRDVNEANSLPATYAMSVAENRAIGTVVGSIAATDLDTAGSAFAQQRYYFLVGGAVSATSADGRYRISDTSGQITTNAALNFEAGTTSAAYTVVARDNAGATGFNQAQSTVTIAITDVNEANSLPATYAMTVNENVAIGTAVGTVTATDLDTAGSLFAQQRYFFLVSGAASANSADGRYTINATTGQITTRAALNFEAGTPSAAYTVIARDNAGNAGFIQAQSTVTIGINDLNEAPTSLNWTPLVTSVAERDRVASGVARPAIDLGTLSVSDPDTAGLPSASYTWSVSDTRFEVINNTLRLKQDASLDFEAATSVVVTLTATDRTGAPFTISRAITIAVTDRDDVLEGTIAAETLTGQAGRDLIYGNGGNDLLSGLAGNDLLDGGDGADTLYGGDGDDSLLGQAGSDRLWGGAGADTLRGGDDADVLRGEDGNDQLYGEGGSDGVRAAGTDAWRGFSQAGLIGGAGNDLLDGGDGDDYLDGGAGADQLIGGAGFDGVDYSASTAAVNVNLATGTGLGGDAQGDTLSGIELVQGSTFGDTLTGSAGNDVIFGGDGNDVIRGGAGNDTLLGGAGNDTIDAEAGDDVLDGGEGNDTLNGGIDNDVYIVTRSSGADTINNYDPSGDDVDMIGFDDATGIIADRDLWFERIGNDLKISVIGTGSSVQVTNWYVVADATSRANHKIDFIIADQSYSRTINIEGLVTLMAGKTRPTTTAARDTLMTDLAYRQSWATFWNANAAPVLAAITPKAGTEATALSFTIAPSDDITPASLIQLSATIVSGTVVSSVSFSAPDANGVRTVTIVPAGYASGTARVRITAADGGGVTTSQEFDVTIAGVPTISTITQFAGGSGTSGLVAGIPLTINASFPDQDGSEVQDILITGVPAGVTLSAGTYDSLSQTWVLKPGQVSGLTVKAPSGWSQDLTLKARARAVENSQTYLSPEVTTTVVINAPPTAISFGGAVNENAAAGTVVGTATATDPDTGDTFTFSLSDTAGGRFTIANNGVLTVANGALLNFEAATSHTVIIKVADSFNAVREQSFTISVNNANEANSLPATYAMAVNENVAVGTLVGTVAASDLDAPAVAFGQQRYYFLVNNAASATSADGRYAINATTGQITTNAPLDFEAGTATVAYTVIARDNAGNAGFNTAQTTVTIAINNLNEQNSLPASYGFGVAELQGVGTTVGTVAASDPDSAGDPFGQQRYFFWDGTNAVSVSWDGRYQINQTTGVITTNQVLDFEGPEPSRSYWVLARDNQGAAGYSQSATTVTIGITNVNEAPNAPDNGVTRWSFLDETGLGDKPANANTAVASFSLSDPDRTSPGLYFADGTRSQGWFYIDASNVVRIIAGLNFNFEWFRANGYNVYDWNGDGRLDAHVADVYVKAFDGALWSGSELLQVFISDVAEAPNAPDNGVTRWSFLDETGWGSNPANTSATVATFSLSDPDGTTPVLRFADGSTSQGWFYIDGNTVRINAGLWFDFEWFRANGYGIYDWNGDGRLDAHVADVYVKAFDGGQWSAPELMQVFISDVNETPSAPDNGVTKWSFLDETGFGANPANAYTQVASFSLSDPDGTVPLLRFADGSTSQGWFYIDGNTVRINPNFNFDFEWFRTNGYNINDWNSDGRLDAHVADVWLKSFDGSLWSAPELVQVFISDVDEPFTLTSRSGSIDEGDKNYVWTNGAAGTFIDLKTMLSSDPEGGRGITWSFAGGALQNGMWSIEPGSGRLYLTSGRSDYEGLTVTYQTQWYFNGWDWETYDVAVRDPSRANMPLAIWATGASGQRLEATMTASINDVAEPPDLSVYVSGGQTVEDSTYSYRIYSGQSGVILTVSGIDPDALGLFTSTVSYKIDGYSFSQVPGYPYTSTFRVYGSTTTNVVGDTPEWARPTPSINQYGQISLSMPWVAGSWGSWGGYYSTTVDYGSFEWSVIVTATDSSGQSTSKTLHLRFMQFGAVKPPIVLDLDGDGLELISTLVSTTQFDMNGDGHKDKVGWVAPDDGLLALDRNGNGMIDDITEISFIDDLQGAMTDLEGLRAYDTNGNGLLDAGDADFARFRIWQDANSDGVSQPDELKSLQERGIASINLTLTLNDEIHSQTDNFVYGTTDYVRNDGTRGIVGDVFLGYQLNVASSSPTGSTLKPPPGATIVTQRPTGPGVVRTNGPNVEASSPASTTPSAPASIATPVVFDLDGDNAPLITLADSETRFDMNGDGIADLTGWIETDDAFLALDRNGNGQIDGIAEISFVADLPGAKTDLEGLVAFDSNADGVLDGKDDRFVEFKLWRDANANGKTDAGELLSLAEAGVTAIVLNGTATGATATSGQNIIYNTSTYALSGGQSGTLLDVGLAFKALKALPETTIQTSTWQGRVKDYRLSASAGLVRIVPRRAAGNLNPEAGSLGPAAEFQIGPHRGGLLSTIVLDLDGDGLEVVRYDKNGAMFDMNGDGVADDTGWMAGGDGMLVIDRDGDGQITDASELSFLSEKKDATSAWDGLAVLDNTKDGKLSSADARFGELKVWVDANGDGVSQQGELKTLADLGIAEISLRQTNTADTAKLGHNLVLSTATFKRDNGLTATVGNVALGFTPSQVAPAPVSTPTAASTDAGAGSLATTQAAASLAQAMSVFGSGSGDSNLTEQAWSGQHSLDWLAVAAA